MGVYKHKDIETHTQTHTHTSSSIVSFLSRGHILLKTHSHLQKGEKNKTRDNNFENYTDNRSHYFKRGFTRRQKCTHIGREQCDIEVRMDCDTV